MAQGISLHIGLNSVDPGAYSGWSGPLQACEADANDMELIAKKRGFKSTKLLTKQGTRSAVTNAMSHAAKTLKAGDIFFLTYSGHGGQLPDLNDDEPDNQDETWCLYDGQIVDDQLNHLYAQFAAGVRVLVLSDSCHSGTVTKLAYYQGTSYSRSATPSSEEIRYRFMPHEIVLRVYRDHADEYDPILQDESLKAARSKVKATVMLISGCQDSQYSQDGMFNGLFTGHLLKVWKNGTFQGDYRTFHKRILSRMPPDQSPNYLIEGAANDAFEKQSPFAI
jgi:metacaspase-1